jgi:hypothetical protein
MFSPFRFSSVSIYSVAKVFISSVLIPRWMSFLMAIGSAVQYVSWLRRRAAAAPVAAYRRRRQPPRPAR